MNQIEGAHPDGRVAVVGGGPAGLCAAEILAQAGHAVDVYDAMPSVGRKFLMAGKGGLNLTHSENFATFVSRYGARRPDLDHMLRSFDPAALRAWALALGVETFVGTSGRVFPVDFKAAPLLRAWLHRLREAGVRFHMRHRWCGWGGDPDPLTLRFQTPLGQVSVEAACVVLALGGGSWARLGSDGAWLPWLQARNIQVAPLKPANCGFDVGWSAHFRERFAGAPVKAVAAGVQADRTAPGEFVITKNGVEGSLIYALSAALRDQIESNGHANLYLDLAPGRDQVSLASAMARSRGKDSTANFLRKRSGIDGVKAGLLREMLGDIDLTDPRRLAAHIKALRLELRAVRPIDEAISTAGGVRFDALNEDLMLRALPGVFCAGEMLDWEAPTGGYLLSACFATGRHAGVGAVTWLSATQEQPRQAERQRASADRPPE